MVLYVGVTSCQWYLRDIEAIMKLFRYKDINDYQRWSEMMKHGDYEIDMEVSWVIGVPLNHPFLDGIFPNKNQPF